MFGVSRDNMASHDEVQGQNLELPFELIADTEEKLCHMFGVVKNKIMYGKKVKGIERSTFLIDANGVLRAEWRGLKVAGHVDEVLKAVKALKKSGLTHRALPRWRRNRPACPSECIMAMPLSTPLHRQSRTATVRLFCFWSLCRDCRSCPCPSRLPESAACCPPPTTNPGRCPHRARRSLTAAVPTASRAAAGARSPPTAPASSAAPARPSAARSRQSSSRPRRRAPGRAKPRAQPARRKLFVLDTNVLMHDPMCLFRFEEHDIYLPMITLEELDGHKKRHDARSRATRARPAATLDALAAAQRRRHRKDGIPLAKHRPPRGAAASCSSRPTCSTSTCRPACRRARPTTRSWASCRRCASSSRERDVVLVSKDINMRVKARALGLPAEDYQNDKTLDDGDLLYTGVLPLPADFWERHGKTMESWQQGGHTFYRISGPLVPALLINQFVYLEAPGAAPLYARVTEITGKTAVLKTLKDYAHAKNAVWGVTARNREQNFALNLLMDPECRLHHADRHRRHRQDADDAGLRPDARCWTTGATPRSS